MEEQLLKIMKILKKFSVEDISIYTECDTKEILPYIENFEKEDLIQKISNEEYLYKNVQNEISYIKESKKSINNITESKQKKKQSGTSFENALIKYIYKLTKNNIKIYKSKKYVFKNLEKYFKGYTVENINTEEILQFKKYLLARGYSHETIIGFIGVLLAILKMYGFVFNQKIFITSSNNCKILTNDEIKDIIMRRGPEAWTIILGLKIPEIAALQYEDIDFKKGTVIISKTFHKGIIYFLHKKQIKKLKLHSFLLNSIDKNKKGDIFGEITMPSFESCLCAHFQLLQQQNVSLNIIAKEMRYQTFNTFYKQFSNLIPQKLNSDFNILEPLGIVNEKT